MTNSPQIGEIAPKFILPRDGGGDISLEALKGAPVIVYFYPKDNTPGCTTQAINFSQKIDEFSSLGVHIIGISADSVKKHDGFKEKHDLQVILASDEERDVISQYGV